MTNRQLVFTIRPMQASNNNSARQQAPAKSSVAGSALSKKSGNTSTHKLNANLWERYRDNLPRYLLGLSRYLQAETMRQLSEEYQHRGLKMSFEPYITLVGTGGCRLTDLASTLSISKQACNQVADQIQAAGYIERREDPSDGRAKRLHLTDRGQQLMHDGAIVTTALEDALQASIGKNAMNQLLHSLSILHRKLQLPQTQVDKHFAIRAQYLAGLLPRLSDYLMSRLMQLTTAKGHRGLKMSHAQVLTLIGPSGGRIQQMANIQAVSKQAISAVVRDLEQLGYVFRQPDPSDARQQRIYFSPKGEALLADSVQSVDELNKEFEDLLGTKFFNQFQACCAKLYHSLQLEDDVFTRTERLQELAQEIKQQFSLQEIQTLSALLQPTAHEVLA